MLTDFRYDAAHNYTFAQDNRMRIHESIRSGQKIKYTMPPDPAKFKISAERHRLCLTKHNRGFANFLILIVAAVACVAGVLLALQTAPGKNTPHQAVQAQLGNTILLPEDFKLVPEFTLLDKDGTSVDANFLKGQWSMLFFGFTHCPDVCPATLSTAANAIKKIQAHDESIPLPKVIFVSVDPKRDTPETLKNYVEYFNTDFNALTGTLNQMYELVTPLNVIVNYTVDEDDPEQYSVDHTASIMLIDPDLRLRAKFNAPHKATEIADDYQTILSHLTSPS